MTVRLFTDEKYDEGRDLAKRLVDATLTGEEAVSEALAAILNAEPAAMAHALGYLAASTVAGALGSLNASGVDVTPESVRAAIELLHGSVDGWRMSRVPNLD